MCWRGLYAPCETTQNTSTGKGVSLFGYTSLYGSVPGGQPEYLRVPQAHFGPVQVPDGFSDERFLYVSDVVPSARIAEHLGVPRVIGVDGVPERLRLARQWGFETVDMNDVDDVTQALLELTAGRGPDAVVEAVGMEAHASPRGKLARSPRGKLARTPRRHRLGQRRLRRRGRPDADADDGDVRPQHPDADGPVPRAPVDGRPSPDRGRGRGPARPRVARNAPGAVSMSP